jgi:hypothetical protein
MVICIGSEQGWTHATMPRSMYAKNKEMAWGCRQLRVAELARESLAMEYDVLFPGDQTAAMTSTLTRLALNGN